MSVAWEIDQLSLIVILYSNLLNLNPHYEGEVLYSSSLRKDVSQCVGSFMREEILFYNQG